MSVKKDVLVLFSFRNHKHGYIEMLFNNLLRSSQNSNLRLHRGSLKDLRIEIVDGQLQITESLTGRPLDSFDAVYFELWYKAQPQALTAAIYLERHEVPYFSKEMLHLSSLTKVSDMAKLSDNLIRLPHTFTSSRREIIAAWRRPSSRPIDYPLIVKAADGYGGNNNYLINDYSELQRVLNSHKDLTFVVQEYIPNDCDYRCIIFDGQIRFVLERRRSCNEKTHLNNTSAGAEGREVPIDCLDSETSAMVLKAAELTGRSSFAGVDVMVNSQTGEPYILEVNQTPQIQEGAETERKMSVLLAHIEEIA